MIVKEVSTSIDGRWIYGFVSGEGKPAILLESGLGGTSEDWQEIVPAAARFSSVLCYDRAGLGRSDRAPVPRTCTDIIQDLRHLLTAAELPPPYILVAHSWSGINARWYANQYPDEIAGMVLIDAVHEEKYAQFAKVLPEDRANRMWASVNDPSMNDENIDRIASIQQVQRNRRSFEFPLIVLTRAADTDKLNRIETGLQANFLKFSSHSKQYISKQGDHFIQNVDPELVIKAIREVVEAARAEAI